MQPLAVDLRVLRTLLAPDIKIVPGRALMARVVSADGTGRGSLSIAGFVTEAELPKSIRSGQDLRLVVRDVSAERVVLSIGGEHPAGAAPAEAARAPMPAPAPAPQAPPPQAPPPAAVPLPGGGTVQVTERDARRGHAGGSAPVQSVALRYDAPALGPVDLRLALDPAALTVAVTVSPAALESARADAETLRRALSEQLGRAVSISIRPRREPVDVYA